jgi:hypothetical protein
MPKLSGGIVRKSRPAFGCFTVTGTDMNSPRTPEERDILDAVWAEFGAFQPGPGPTPVPGNTAPSNDSPTATTARQLAGCLVLVATVGCCDFLLVSHGSAAASAWPLIAYAVAAALGGAAAGFLLASRYPLPGLLAGVCSGAGSVCAAAWASGRLASPDPVIVGIVALAGLVPGGGAYYPLRWLQRSVSRTLAASPDGTARPAGPPFAVIYDPPAEPPDPRAALLEERLLHLCKQDRRLFDRLLHYERTQHQGRRRVELLRLAIEHFVRDNR